MKNRPLLAAAAIFCAASLGLTACGGGEAGEASGGTSEKPSGPVEITYTWWGSQDRADRMQKAIAAFEKANPDIKVKPNFTDYEGYWQKRSTEAAGGGLPDVMQFDFSYLRQYADRGALLDLGEVEGGVDLSGIDESLLPAGQIDEGTFGVPIGTNALAMYYNPEIVTQLGVEAPKEGMTWEEYNAWIKEASAKGAGNVWGAGDYSGVLWLFDMKLRQEGKALLDEEGKLAIEKADLKKWLESTAELRQAKAVVPADRVTQIAPLSVFGAKLTATEMSWDNFLAGYLKDSGAAKIEMLTPPTTGGEKGLFVKPSMLYAVGANTENPEAAAEFVDFMTNDAEVGKIFGTSRGVPASKTQRDAVAAEGPDAQVLAYEEAIAADLDESPAPLPAGFGSLEKELLRLAEEINYGRLTVDQAVEEWFTEAEAALEQ
ncbi:extracellular solute-binding protein [Kineococcus sp. NUM-3379]